MKAATTTRPARRMSAEKWATLTAQVEAARQRRENERQAREDEQQARLAPVEEYTPAPRLTLLPGGLHWSGQQQVPAVGDTVAVQEPGTKQARLAQVQGYCHAAGFLGLVVEPQASKPGRGSRRPSQRAGCVFGSQLLEQAA